MEISGASAEHVYMDTREHQPGCDGRHGPRARCVVRAAAETNVADDERDAVNRARVVSTSGHRSRLAVGIVALTPIVLVAAGLLYFVGGVGRTDADNERVRLGPAEMPAWGRPADAVVLRDEATCEGAVWARPCRTMAFGVGGPYEELIAAVKAAYEARGVWSTSYEYHDLSLHVVDRARTHCLVYYQASPQTGYEAVIEVVLDGCGYYPR